jgi:hypothetical protein
MSASLVRSKVRQWCGEVAVAAAVPFYDTVNVHVVPADDVWFTVAFTAEIHEGTYNVWNYVETGFISFVFVARAGIGDVACLAAVETVIPAIMAKVDGNLTLINYEPIDEDSLGSADKDYRMSVSVNYRYSM